LSESAATERRLALGVKLDENNLIRVSVADNGVGIPEENLDRIFFARVYHAPKWTRIGSAQRVLCRPGNGRHPARTQ